MVHTYLQPAWQAPMMPGFRDPPDRHVPVATAPGMESMPARRRQPIPPTDDWQQLELLTNVPEQLTYELIRPVVLFGRSPAERARQTGTPQRTLYRQAARFDADGMASLFAPFATRSPVVPAVIREAIRTLKAEYPAFRPHELATICATRFGHRPSAHTVKRVLAEAPLPLTAQRRFPPYHQIADPAERRLAIIRLHSEGWNIKSIPGYLGVDRHTVYATLQRWINEGVCGLDDKSRARKDGVRKIDLRTMELVLDPQENPELGEFRIHAALKQLGIELSPRTCGRILARNRALYGLPAPTRQLHDSKAMPFKASRRHQYWTVDLRYLDHNLDDGKVYCLSILENYSQGGLRADILTDGEMRLGDTITAAGQSSS